jgi:hypothetical protein
MSEPIVLPELRWHPTAASGLRHGSLVELVVVHRWGVRYLSEPAEAIDYESVVRYFSDPSHQASAHVVFPGSAVPGQATQMVSWAHMAWTEAAYNPVADDVESADACWLRDSSGHVIDPHGLQVLARIVAYRLHVRGLPAVWSHRRGFCRHADLGAAGGGHLQCPTTDLGLWRYFVKRVQAETERGGFRKEWGR